MVIAVLLLSLVVVSVGSAMESRRQAERVAAERDRAQQVTKFLTDLFKSNDPDRSRGREITAQELLDQGARQVRRAFDGAPELRVEMLVLLGDLYRQIGEYEAARPLLEEGLELAQNGGEPESRAEALQAIGILDREIGHRDDALEALEQAESLMQEAGLVPSQQHALLSSYLTVSLLKVDRLAETVRRAEAALATARDDPFYSLVLANLGDLLRNRGHHRGAEELLLEALEINRTLLGPDNHRVARCFGLLARLRLDQGRPVEALELAEEALALLQRIGFDNPRRTLFVFGVRAQALVRLGRVEKARASFTEAIARGEAAGPDAGREWPRLLAAHAEFLIDHGAPGASAASEQALEAMRETFGDAHAATRRAEELQVAGHEEEAAGGGG